MGRHCEHQVGRLLSIFFFLVAGVYLFGVIGQGVGLGVSAAQAQAGGADAPGKLRDGALLMVQQHLVDQQGAGRID